jgi:phospholipase C
VRDGQQFVADIYEALLNGGRNLWEKTVLIITYDEHGGFFDHVDPRTFPAAPDRRGFDRYGIRVPTLIVSPWVEPGSVSHTIFDHTSILKTILKRFGKKGVKMSARVEASHDLWELLEGQTAPRSDRLSLPTTSIAAAPMLSLMGVDTADLQDSNRRLYDDLPPTDLQKNLLKQIGIAEVSPRQLKPR